MMNLPINNPLNNMANFIKEFNQFKANFQGDPQKQVQNLLNTGQMSQAQFNELQSLAMQLRNVLR